MSVDPIQALRGARHPAPRGKPHGSLLIAGATGALGNEVLRRLVGLQRFASTRVLAREPITPALRTVSALVVGAKGVAGQGTEEDIAGWPLAPADAGIIMFEPSRVADGRERALWTPRPAQLAELARWMRRGGVHTLALVLPHAQGRLPEALKRGLATIDELAVAAMGFERLLIVRSAQKAGPGPASGFFEKLGRAMLSIVRFMVPDSEQPVRASKVAEFVAEALRVLPPGIHVAAPELVWQAGQGNARAVVQAWLGHAAAQSTAKSAA